MWKTAKSFICKKNGFMGKKIYSRMEKNMSAKAMHAFSRTNGTHKRVLLVGCIVVASSLFFKQISSPASCALWGEDTDTVSKKFRNAKKKIIDSISAYYGDKSNFARSRITVSALSGYSLI